MLRPGLRSSELLSLAVWRPDPGASTHSVRVSAPVGLRWMRCLAVRFGVNGDLSAPLAFLRYMIASQACLFPLLIIRRHPAQPPVFALADPIAGQLRLPLRLGAHPKILRVAIPGPQGPPIPENGHDNDQDRERHPPLRFHDGTPFAPLT